MEAVGKQASKEKDCGQRLAKCLTQTPPTPMGKGQLLVQSPPWLNCWQCRIGSLSEWSPAMKASERL
ncbi:hypothetical protein E2562_013332 [Oryza meyeriana var. granulata]|uniref:Uncharacterized protein n=1 Tax=Oryza meyeriana var. granulata TaxID=110450 RepID=A0A6G1CG33_9ORYZ|nr:hypothetical protein E2562_013332 [Oryza meyeriana var. granulata]